MRRQRPTDLFAGVDNLSLDQREFNPSRDDIEGICRFFCLGKLQHYEKEKGIAVSHSNFFVFVATAHGQYAFKFYPADAAKTIAIEYTLNKFLTGHNFPTPVMHASHDGQPFFASNNQLTACYSYLAGLPAWQHIKKRNTIRKINAAMLSVKEILSRTKGRIPFLKQEKLTTTINALGKASRAITSYDQKETIELILLDTYRAYQNHQPLFTRQWLHNNSTLTNFLIEHETVYTLDLSHIREDYILADLAALIISCLFLDIPRETIKNIVDNYFTLHKIEKKHFLVLNALVKIGLIKEYLKNVQREEPLNLSTCPPDITKIYLSHLQARKKFIISVLKKMTDTSKFII